MEKTFQFQATILQFRFIHSAAFISAVLMDEYENKNHRFNLQKIIVYIITLQSILILYHLVSSEFRELTSYIMMKMEAF